MPPVSVVRYSATAIVLHWLMAALVVAGFSLGWSMVDLPFSPTRLRWYSWHKWIGVTVLGLAALRLVWRLSHAPPSLPDTVPAWQRRASTATHWLLYGLMLSTPVAGWLFSSAKGLPTVYLGLWQLPDLVARDDALAAVLKAGHMVLAYGLAALVGLHVAAALKHHFIDRDAVLARMLPFLRPRGASHGKK